MQNHNDDTIKTSDSLLEKIYLSLYWKGCVWEGVGDQTELQHIDPHSSSPNSVSFLFSCAAQLGAWGLPLLCAGFLYRILGLVFVKKRLRGEANIPSLRRLQLQSNIFTLYKLEALKPLWRLSSTRHGRLNNVRFVHNCIHKFDIVSNLPSCGSKYIPLEYNINC